MRRYGPLIMNDLRQISSDPMLMASLLGPLAVIAFARFLFPLLSIWMEQQFSFSLNEYSDFSAAFLVLTIPLLPGTMAGLLMLDERDENLISYYAATPLTRHGYMLYRLMLPCLLSTMLSAAFILVSGLAAMQFENVYMLILLALEAPLLALLLAAFSSNKVEGLALSKISGLLFAGPVVAAFVEEPWSFIAFWIPTFWPAKAYLSGAANEPFYALFAFGAGLLLHIFLLAVVWRAFKKRID